MTGPRSFDRNELGTDRPDELEDALTAAAWVDEAVDTVRVAPSPGFGDRVMMALADEPAPSSVGFLAPVWRRGYLAGFVASVRQAWVTAGGGGRPVLARATALAYVLAVVIAGTSLAGVATVGLAGAFGLLGPTASQTPSPQAPGPTRAPETDLPAAESAPPPTVGESDEPSETPDASGDHGGAGAEPSDDHGGGPGPGESDDDHGDHAGPGSSGSGSDDGSGDDSEEGTPKPSETPRPSGTPKPSETPD